MQKAIRLNDGHVVTLGLLAQKDGTRKGYLSKRSADNPKWQTKWFALLQNLLFYFESDSSPRPSGLYLLEGSICKRAPSPKRGTSSKESGEKQQHYFTVNFSNDSQKTLELRTEDDQNHSDEDNTEVSPVKSPPTPKSFLNRTITEFPFFNYNNGILMTTCRDLVDNNRSTLSATSAFAIATAGANEGPSNKEVFRRMSLANTGFSSDQRNIDKEFVIRRAATNRVLNVLRHWVTKHTQDFDTDDTLKYRVICFLEEVMHDPDLLTQERKAAANIIRTLTLEETTEQHSMLEEVILMTEGVKTEPFENHPALEIAEQLTLLDHLVFKSIPYEEFFGQGWMKAEKYERTPNYTEDGLVNFSKMRMISHIIREIRQFQQTTYKIDPQPKVIQYLLDESFMLDEESLYESSLLIEPKLPT